MNRQSWQKPVSRLEHTSVLRTHELALRSKRILDVPRRTTQLMLAAGMCGLILIIVGSLSGNRPETIAVDKLLHFGGYAALAIAFVLALRPRFYIPMLLVLAGLSYAIELLQPLNLRTPDPGDALANTLGLAIGAAIGLGLRLAYGYIRTELMTGRIRRRIERVHPGEMILCSGELVDRFFIIKRGHVALFQEDRTGRRLIDQLGPGEMFGLLASRLPEPAILLGKVLMPTLWAWLVAQGLVLISLVTVNIAFSEGELLLFDPGISMVGMGFGMLLGLMLALAGMLLSLRAESVRQAQQTLSLAWLGLLAIYFVLIVGVLYLLEFAGVDIGAWLESGRLALPALGAAGILLLLDAGLLGLALQRFRRSRMLEA